MEEIKRIIPATIDENGVVSYRSVTSRPDNSIAVCHMIPNRFIPVIFVPGVMGSNLISIAGKYKGKKVWLLNTKIGLAWDWIGRGAEVRKQALDPMTTKVYEDGDIPSGTTKSKAELRRRGWGTVANASYGDFLKFLENALDDGPTCKTGLRDHLKSLLVAEAPGVSKLTHDEVELSYKYSLSLHAVGYNWLQSNADSAKHLATKINEFIDYYKRRNKRCEKVIIVTHSMGGLVARYYSEVDGHSDKVLGIVHGVMPTTGAAAAYKRVVAGTEGIAGWVLGPNSATMTAVFAQSPGPLQLLPSAEYGMGWLKLRRGQEQISLPEKNPYEEVYLERGKWWRPVNDKLINPMDKENIKIDADWDAYEMLIKTDVRPFHEAMCGKFHSATYAFYGNDQKHKTWGDVMWKCRLYSIVEWANSYAKVYKLENGRVIENDGEGKIIVFYGHDGHRITAEYNVMPADENGDGTVPVRSGRAPMGHPGVQVCVGYPGVDHEEAYKERPQRLFALWAITRIIGNVKGTSLEYTS